MNRSRSARDTLTSQLFEDFDALADHVEALQKTALDIDRQIQVTNAAMAEGSDRFRMAVTAFTEQAKTDLKEDAERTRAALLARGSDDIQIAMQKAARTAFEAQSWDTARTLASHLKGAANEFRRGLWSRVLENGVVALVAGMLASAMTYGLMSR